MNHCVDCDNHQHKVTKAGIPMFRIIVKEEHLCHWRQREDPVTGPIEQPPQDCYSVRDKALNKTKCPGFIPHRRFSRECM